MVILHSVDHIFIYMYIIMTLLFATCFAYKIIAQCMYISTVYCIIIILVYLKNLLM